MVLPLLLLAALQAPARVTSPLVERMLARAVPPPSGEVRLDVLVSADSLRVGEQLDVVTVAWFPRDLLSRLPRPPVIRPPSIPGVFAAIQPTTPEVAGSRIVGDLRYELYVAHHVVFPLDEGELYLPSASLRYSLPAGRERRVGEEAVDRTTPVRTVRVLPLPPGGQGPVGSRLAFRWTMAPVVPRAGEPIPLELTLSGRGNLALWPAPTLRFPEGTRGYVGAQAVSGNVLEGRYGGTRVWRYTLVVDSAGTVVVPDLSYPHFDPVRSAWREVTAKGVVIPVLPAPAGVARRAPVTALARSPRGLWAWSGGVQLVLLLLGAGPALVFGLRRGAQARRHPNPRGSASPGEELVARVRSLVPDPGRRDGDHLSAALREAGLSPEVSAEAAAAYAASTGQRFAPAGPVGASEAERSAEQVLGRWPARLGTALLVAVIALASSPTRGVAAGDPVALSQQAAAAWAAGQDAEAAAAWIAARRLVPRSAVLRTGWNAVAVRSADLRRLGWVSPLTPVEWALLTGVLWSLAWVGWLTGRRRLGWSTLALALVAGACSAVLVWRYAHPEAIVARAVTARQAPHGLAAEQGTLEPLTVVSLRGARAGWYRVHQPRLGEGWVPAAALVVLPSASTASPPGGVR